MSRRLKIFPLLMITLIATSGCTSSSENVRRTQNARCAEIGKLPAPVDLIPYDRFTRADHLALYRAYAKVLRHDDRAVKCVKLLKDDLIRTDARERCLRRQVRHYESSPLPGSLLVGVRCDE